MIFHKFPMSVDFCDPEDREKAQKLNLPVPSVQEVRFVHVDPVRVESFYSTSINHDGKRVESVNVFMSSGEQFTIMCDIDSFIKKMKIEVV